MTTIGDLRLHYPRNNDISKEELNEAIESLGHSNYVPQLFQVFFLPTEQVDSPKTYTAFCPFTGITAEGDTVQQAAQRWTELARLRFATKTFTLNLISRKVWYGEKEHPVYIIDWADIPNVVAVCPATHQTLAGSHLRNSQEILPESVIDWKVKCTPLTKFPISLTPHHIN